MENDGSHLVSAFQLAPEAAFRQPSLDTYPSDGSVPDGSGLVPEDQYNLGGR